MTYDEVVDYLNCMEKDSEYPQWGNSLADGLIYLDNAFKRTWFYFGSDEKSREFLWAFVSIGKVILEKHSRPLPPAAIQDLSYGDYLLSIEDHLSMAKFCYLEKERALALDRISSAVQAGLECLMKYDTK